MVSFTGSSETPTQNTSASPSSYPDAAEPKLEQDLPRDESNVTQFNTSHGPSSRGVVGAAVLHARTTVCHAARVVHAACINPIVWIIVAYVAWTSLSGTINPFIESPRTADCNSSSKLDRTTGCPTPELFSPNFRKLVTFQSRFQGAMEESTSASIIAVDIKRSEMAIRDLTTLVDLSSIVSKDSLAKNLRKFVEDARTTGRGLQKFGGHIRSAVDQIVTLNEHAIDLLERSIKDTQPQLDHGLFRRAIKGLYRDKPVPCEVIEARNREIKGVWVEAIGTMKSSIEKLIIEAAVNAKALDRLEGHLSVIYNIASRADKKAAQDKSELLGRLWTSLGGNKAQLAEYDSHLQLLNAVQNYRKDAANHVTSTILQLQQMELDLIDMNEMVATSTLSRKDSEAGTSLMSHIATIQKGTDKLLRGRASIRERENNYMQKVFGNLH